LGRGNFVLLRRSGVVFGLAALVAASCLHADNITAASPSSERTISFYHIHTHESLTITYKRDGKYIPDALKKINWIMRDWRKNEVKEISPQTIDLAWEMHEELGSKEPINIICGYRSSGTNEMLRKTRGGQAKFSQHITGKAIDITFPDVPLKKMRYSALIRERGGVGYYPTSGIPFVHVDTAHVRMWPRMPRYELALLFPNGRSKYVPTDGRPITPSDVKAAQSTHRELSVQVAQFFQARLKPGTSRTMVASAQVGTGKSRLSVVASLGGGSTRRNVKLTTEPDPAPAVKDPKPFAPARVTLASANAEDGLPHLVSAPRLMDRPSHFTPTPSTADRSKLDALVAAAATTPIPELVAGPKPAVRPQKALAAAALAESGAPVKPRPSARVASLDPAAAASVTDMSPNSLGNGWAEAPAFDEDHPEELAYRPFPLAPLLNDNPDSQDAPLADLQPPDVAATLDALDDTGSVAPMKFRPGQQIAEEMWAQQFQGKAVHSEALMELAQRPPPTGMESRKVLTSSR
jgi:uncharacterized protein YcbK (DUF882 family)